MADPGPLVSGVGLASLSRVPPPGRASAYFDQVRQSIVEAGRRVGVTERRYHIGGRAVCVSFAGSELVPALTRALSHLPSPRATEPSLSVLVADGRVVRPPPVPWDPPAPPVPARADQARRPAVYARDERVRGLLELERGTLSMYDTASALGLFWASSAEKLPYYERGAPLRAILDWWGHDQGWHVVHAGAVGTEKGGVLLVGKAGSGKSTAVLACLGAGFSYAGDDGVAVGGGPVPLVHSLYCTAKLEPRHLRGVLPHLAAMLEDSEAADHGKRMFFLDRLQAADRTASFPLRAVLLPRVTGAPRSTTRLVSSATGLLALAPSTLFQLPGARPDRLRHMADMLRRVPAHVLELGSDLATVAPAIRAVLDDATR